MNTPKKDLCDDIDARIDKDVTSNICHDSNLLHDTDSTTSTELKIPSNIDDNFQDETF